MTTTVEPEYDHASGLLQDMIRRNRNGEKFGLYAVCSAHPSVIDAAMRQSMENGSVLLVESTSSQVNQFGGCTGQTPDQFAEFVHSAAQQAGLRRQRVLLGGDHLGPYPWRELRLDRRGASAQLSNRCLLHHGRHGQDEWLVPYATAKRGLLVWQREQTTTKKGEQ